MEIRFRNRILIVLVILTFLMSSKPFGFFASQVEGTFEEIQDEHTFTLLDELPISLEDVLSV